MPRLAIAQIRPTKGDYGANLQKIGGVLAQVGTLDPPVDLVIFPETATSGYFVEGGVRDVAVTAGTLFRDLRVQPLSEVPRDAYDYVIIGSMPGKVAITTQLEALGLRMRAEFGTLAFAMDYLLKDRAA